MADSLPRCLGDKFSTLNTGGIFSKENPGSPEFLEVLFYWKLTIQLLGVHVGALAVSHCTGVVDRDPYVVDGSEIRRSPPGM